MSNPYVLCTGGCGFIGSHTAIALQKLNYRVGILDNLSNSNLKVLDRIAEVTGVKPEFFQLCLVKDADKVEELFQREKFDAVIHFAGLKAVGESISIPLKYYHNNITGTLLLLESMIKANCKTLIFSSSATVYQPGAETDTTSRVETDPLGPINPYGQTKFMIEQILRDVYESDKDFAIELLRYFNPTGAHESGRLGEHPDGIPNNLMPFIAQVAIEKRPHLNVFGGDWPTEDGTCIRDFIHVLDLAEGHVAALLHRLNKPGIDVHNLGSGRGHSVLEMASAFGKACGKEIKTVITDRRPGDMCYVVSDPSKAEKDFGWKTKRTVEDMCQSAWKWQSAHPNGYDSNDENENEDAEESK